MDKWPRTNIISDLFLPSVISKAKNLLVRDVEALNLVEKWPRPTRRRASDLGARAFKDIQDITAVWTYIDNLGLIKSLPIYVAANLDVVPTAKFEDGDIRAIYSKLDKIEEATRDVKKSVNDFRASSANICKSLGLVPAASFHINSGQLRSHDPQRNLSASAGLSSNPEQSCTSEDDDWQLRVSRSGKKRARQASQLAAHPDQLILPSSLNIPVIKPGMSYRDVAHTNGNLQQTKPRMKKSWGSSKTTNGILSIQVVQRNSNQEEDFLCR